MRILTRKECFEKLYYIFKHRQEKGWDGYKAKPVNTKSAVNTILFLLELPKDIESPRPIFISTDERIFLIWQTSLAHRIKQKKEHYISMRMNTEEKTITIQGSTFGKHKILINTTHDFSNGIPEQVIELLREITKLNSKSETVS